MRRVATNATTVNYDRKMFKVSQFLTFLVLLCFLPLWLRLGIKYDMTDVDVNGSIYR
jgi:hypothetical protein